MNGLRLCSFYILIWYASCYSSGNDAKTKGNTYTTYTTDDTRMTHIENMSNMTNTTCENGFTPTTCSSGPICLAVCDNRSFILSQDCASRVCKTCEPGTWCDGTDQHQCTIGTTSPIGSNNEDDCVCHAGYMIDNTSNPSVCVMCSKGYWCDKKHEFDCPDGTTSRPASRSELNCYCIPGYNGSASNDTINCEERTNATHSPCDIGHFYDANETCHMCDPGNWCDGEVQNICDKGLSSPSASHSWDNCTCFPGVERGACSAIIQFTVTLAMTIQEFDIENKTLYIAIVANSLSTPITSVYIDVVSENTPSRRLLRYRSSVRTHVIVQNIRALSSLVRATQIRSNLDQNGLEVEEIEEATVVYIHEEEEEDGPDNTMLVILILSLCVIIVGCISAWLYVKVNGDHLKYGELPEQKELL